MALGLRRRLRRLPGLGIPLARPQGEGAVAPPGYQILTGKAADGSTFNVTGKQPDGTTVQPLTGKQPT